MGDRRFFPRWPRGFPWSLHFRTQWFGLLLGTLFLVSQCEPSVVPLSPLQLQPTPEAHRTGFVHLFEWRWDDIAQECETFLGPQGYDAVQISPPQEHVLLPEHQFPWWQRYQPVSYQLVSRSGDRAQLAQMIRRCHQAGVKVYADAVINHMAGVESGVGSAGIRFTKYHYPGLYTDEDFNPCRRDIDTYQDRHTVTQCELVGLADLNLQSPPVRHQIVAYLTDLVSLGIDGFRIDAAKHIPADDLNALLNELRARVEPDPYIYQEVIDPGTEAISKWEFSPSGDVLEFEYGRIVGESFMALNHRSLAQLETLGERWGLMASDQAVVFIDNHDKQRGHGGGGNYLTHQQETLYTLANIFMLAFPYGYPQVMSSYFFAHSDQGPPADSNGVTQSVFVNGQPTCGQGWVCEHRWPAIASMIAFRNHTEGHPLTHWWSNGHNQIAFGRGDRGFVIINREDHPLTRRFQTDLPPGEYCNLLTEDPCTEKINVDVEGQFEGTVEGMGAIALVRA